MSGQPLPKHRPFDGRWTGRGFGIYLSRFSSPLKPAFDRGQGDPEGPRDLRPRHPTIYRIQHLHSEILRIRSHARESRRGSSTMQAAVRTLLPPLALRRWLVAPEALSTGATPAAAAKASAEANLPRSPT